MKDNENYYFGVGAGAWHGTFSFEVHDIPGLLGTTAPAADKFSALALHGLLKVLPKATINSQIRGLPGARLAKSAATVMVTTFPLARLSPVRIYALRGYYRLDDDGSRVRVRMHEEFSPIPLVFYRNVSATAVVAAGGMGAQYALEMFGSPWIGKYQIAPTKDHVDVRYTCPWGELRYQADKELPAPAAEPPLPPPEIAEVQAVAHRLEDKAEQYRAAGDLLAVFTELYANVTYSVAEALDGAGAGRTFRDRAWVAKLAGAFQRRYLAAIHARDTDGYVPAWWRPVLQALRVRKMTELDAAALCVYAHIVGDLPHALADVDALAEDAEARLADYDLLSDVLGACIDDAENELTDLYGVLYGWLDLLGGRFDEVFVAKELRELRAVAWYDGSRLLARDPEVRLDAEERIVRRVEDFVSDVLDPEPAPVAALAQLTRSVFASIRRW